MVPDNDLNCRNLEGDSDLSGVWQELSISSYD